MASRALSLIRGGVEHDPSRLEADQHVQGWVMITTISPPRPGPAVDAETEEASEAEEEFDPEDEDEDEEV